MKKINISIIGGGNVASHLARAFLKQENVCLKQIYNRNINALKEFESATEIIDDINQLKPVDLSLIAISDDAVKNFSKKLNGFEHLIAHTAGSVPVDDLQVKRKGVFYPFQTFSKAKKEMDFHRIPILIEAKNTDDLKLLQYTAGLLSQKVIISDSIQRKTLHIAGIIVSNFVNHLYVQADKLLKEQNLSFDLLKPLIMEVAEKVQNLSPADAQTGPALRGDHKIIQNHLEFIKDKDLLKIYQLISELIATASKTKN
jgi:predicted short-subunit dehydrogenase-like oxidoreductase (DUF2520 family)